MCGETTNCVRFLWKRAYRKARQRMRLDRLIGSAYHAAVLGISRRYWSDGVLLQLNSFCQRELTISPKSSGYLTFEARCSKLESGCAVMREG